MAKEAWHTAPWESAKAAFGAKGAAVLAAVGGAAAIGLVAVATVAVAGGGGGGKGADGVEISSGGKDGDREIGSGGKDGDDDTSTTSSTTSSTTTSTVPGQPTTTQRSGTPGGPDPTDTTRAPVSTRPPITTTRPPATQPPSPPPTIHRLDYVYNHNCRTDPNAQIDVTIRWASNGTSATLTPSGGKPIRVTPTDDKYQTCTHPGHVWTLTVTGANGKSTQEDVTPQRPQG